MTPENINKSVRKYWLVASLASAPLIALMYASPHISWIIAKLLFDSPSKGEAGNIVLALMAFAVTAFLVVIFSVQRKVLPTCPSCKKGFVPNNCGIVIATKHCPYCGAQVINGNP